MAAGPGESEQISSSAGSQKRTKRGEPKTPSIDEDRTAANPQTPSEVQVFVSPGAPVTDTNTGKFSGPNSQVKTPPSRGAAKALALGRPEQRRAVEPILLSTKSLLTVSFAF